MPSITGSFTVETLKAKSYRFRGGVTLHTFIVFEGQLSTVGGGNSPRLGGGNSPWITLSIHRFTHIFIFPFSCYPQHYFMLLYKNPSSKTGVFHIK